MSFLKHLLITIFALVVYQSHAQLSDTTKINPQPKHVILNLDSSTYQRVIAPPASLGIHSGLVTLKPGETVGHHNTDDYDEMIIIFSGEGQMSFEDGQKFNLKFGEVAYCPPHTEHDMKNIETTLLKYLYIATKTKK